MKTPDEQSEVRNFLEMDILSDYKMVEKVRGVILEEAKRAGFVQDEMAELAVVVNEACANIIEHAYGNDPTRVILVRVRSSLGRIELSFKDFGKKIDTAVLRASPARLKPNRGFGLLLLQNLTDAVVYDTSMTVGTELKVVKYARSEKIR